MAAGRVNAVSILGSKQLGRRLHSVRGPCDSAQRADIHHLLNQGPATGLRTGRLAFPATARYGAIRSR